MGYQSRKRNYRSRREKLAAYLRNIRIITIFLLIGLGLYLLFNWVEIRDWLQTYFY